MIYSKFADESLFKAAPTLQYSSFHKLMWCWRASVNKFDNLRIHDTLYKEFGVGNLKKDYYSLILCSSISKSQVSHKEVAWLWWW